MLGFQSKIHRENSMKKNPFDTGFTLVEMIVTMVVLSITLTLAVAGLLTWQDWSNFKKENEYAQTLFIAAQNQLTEFGSDGRLLLLQQSLAGGSVEDFPSGEKQYEAVGLNLTDHVSKLKDSDGVAYSLDTLFPQSAGKAQKNLYQDEIVSLRANAGDYAAYLQDPKAFKESNTQAYWVFELLGEYVYDISILNGNKKGEGSGSGAAICVELTPKDGQVFSVLYSDKNDKFIYLGVTNDTNGNAEQQGVADIADRTEAYRMERMVGYFSVDTLYASTKNVRIRPQIASVKLYNKDTFYLTCRLAEKYKNLMTSQLTYVIDLNASKSVNDKKLTITLDGTKLKNAANAETVLCPVSRYDADGKEVLLGDFPVLAWLEEDNTIHVLLDAADMQATTQLYKEELDAIRTPSKAADTKFAKTYSFFRFGVKPDNVYASVTATGAGITASKPVSNFGNLNIVKNQSEKHTCFAGYVKRTEDGKNRFDYSVTNARHLFNIRYIEDLSYEQEAVSSDPADQIEAVTFTLKKDIDWVEFQKDGQLLDSYAKTNNIRISSLDKKLIDPDGKVIQKVTSRNCDFPSFAQLRKNDHLDGNQKTIKGIAISEISNVLYGLYTVPGTDPATYSVAQTRPVGLVNINYGTIENLSLDCITASGLDFVGAFCGINAGGVKNLAVQNSDEKSMIAGRKHVGAVTGFVLAHEVDNKVEHLKNEAAVQGVLSVGGIVGMLRNDYVFGDFDFKNMPGLPASLNNFLINHADAITIVVSDCENYGTVTGVNEDELCEIYEAKKQEPGESQNENKAQTKSTLAKVVIGEDEDPKEAITPRYIGGITGYCYNTYSDPEKLKIVDCTSAPLYKGEELSAILSDEGKLKDKLKGVYVGGIAGYNYYGQIGSCSTKPKKGKYGCLFGYCYVGGIVGYNIGPASGIDGTINQKQGENDNHVIAVAFAGGITGCNANVRDEDSLGKDISASDAKDPEKLEGLLLADSSRNLHVKIDNWINRGIILAVNKYAGGITGYNAGFIYRCNSDVESSVAEELFAALVCGDYAGGIAGYNNGVIGNTERTVAADGASSTVKSAGEKFSTICYVKGRNYVGGIVGYNDVDSIVEDYETAGGYVIGTKDSCFVGGYAGFNASIDLLMNLSGAEKQARLIHANPNHVQGGYMVGGNVGANIINMADTPEINTINGVFLTDNFLGILEGKAFVGGFVGYNLLFENSNLEEWIAKDADAAFGSSYIVQRELLKAFKQTEDETRTEEEKLVLKKEILDELADSINLPLSASEKNMVISGQGHDATKVSFGTISASIYVGGVLGYNDENTKLTVKNVENSTPIEATKAVSYDKEQILSIDETTKEETYRTCDYANKEKKYTYSYAGGIIGKTNANTTLENCWNASSGMVKTKGTYTGGLCEINEGQIVKCEVTNFGNSVLDYVGGLCGLNKNEIKNCSIENKTVSGRNVVGGLVAENFGDISDISFDKAKMLVDGVTVAAGQKHGVCGLVAAFNAAKGTIRLNTDIKNISIISQGDYVGGIAGINEGLVSNEKAKPDQQNTKKNIQISGTIRGNKIVGGLFGRTQGKKSTDEIQYFTNKALVTATSGIAGGIVGENDGAGAIRYCINEAIVTASDAGNAGGISSANNSLIAYCYDYQTVSAPEGMCGGITAVNEREGKLVHCYVAPLPGAKTITFRSARTVGAMAAQNKGLIESFHLSDVTVTNETTHTGTRLGIVAGENRADGRILFADSRQVSESIDSCRIVVNSNFSYAGGVAGRNEGLIQGVADENGQILSVVSTALSLEKANVVDLGGIAGLNTGKIVDLSADGIIQGDLGSESYGYGGIAGVSGYTSQKDYLLAHKDGKKQDDCLIENCSFDGVINASGSSGASVRIGGIVGINGYGAKVEDCLLGARDKDLLGKKTQESGSTYITAGDYKNKTAESVSTTDTKSYAYLGGIAGYNYGRISFCDNAQRSVDQVSIIAFAGETGGIVGFNDETGIVSGYFDEDSKTEKIVSTGKNWVIEQRCCGNDRGPGGIIGKSVSAEPMNYVINYAKVECRYMSNCYVGGLIGVLEMQKALMIDMKACENFGQLYSARSAGGFIGMMINGGVRFTDCTNWGSVTAEKLRSGGFVSLHYTFPVGCEFRNCANHGNITVLKSNENPFLGGFIAEEKGAYKVDNTDSMTYFYDCVNTGNICLKDKNEKYAKAGAFGGQMQSASYLELCRNYNTYTTNVNGFIANGWNTFVKNCLDDSNSTTKETANSPYGGRLNATSNACVLNEDSKTSFLHDSYGVYFTIHEGRNQDGNFSINSSQAEKILNPAAYFTEPSRGTEFMLWSKQPKAWIDLSYDDDSKGMDSFVVYFWNYNRKTDSQPGRAASCKATYYYSNATSIELPKQTALGSFDASSKIIFKNPDQDKKPVRIKLEFEGDSPVALRGFSFIAQEEADTQKEAVCSYAGEQYGMTFSLDKMQKTTSSGSVSTVKMNQKLPADHRYRNENDTFVIPWEDNSTFYFPCSKDDTLDLTFNVFSKEKATEMEAFVFYLANNTGQGRPGTYYYDYSATFAYEDGSEVVTDVVTDAVGYDNQLEPAYMEKSRQEIAVPKSQDARLTSVTLHIKNTKYTYMDRGTLVTNTNNVGTVYLRGFGFKPKDKQEQRLAAGIHISATQSYFDRSETNEGKTLVFQQLLVDQVDGRSYVYSPYNYDYGFYMSHKGNNPIGSTYYGDNQSTYEDSVTQNKDSGSRIDTYLDLDPKFKALMMQIAATNQKLNMPTNIKQTEINGNVRFSWDRVLNAYQYEVYYEVENDGNQVFVSAPVMLGSLQRSFDIELKNEWPQGSEIKFYIRAINAYHPIHESEEATTYDPQYEKYDSDWVCSQGNAAKKALPRPLVHLEIVPGNRTVAVLDNYASYEALGCLDSQIYVNYKNAVLSWNLKDTGKYSKPTYVEAPGEGQATIIYYAIPKETIADSYAKSAASTLIGEGFGNNNLPGRDMYCKTYFDGFYGTDADKMEYRISFNLGARDSYLYTDILAYDEAVGATVAYDNEITHAANSASGGGSLILTSTLKNLPKEWFAQDTIDNVTVRAYPYRAQFDIIHYGHEVASGIHLSGSKEENQAILAGIVDSVYFSKDSDVPVDNTIWDEKAKDLKDGYVLQKQEDGTYQVYYSALIEMSKLQAKELREQTAEWYPEYKNYAVAYAIYSDMAKETNGVTRVNNYDFMESYWVRRMEADGGYHQRPNNTELETTNRLLIQEKMPAPILEDDVIASVDENGNAQYTFNWDIFYRDTACPYANTNDKNKLTNAPKGLFPSWDLYLDYYEKQNKGHFNIWTQCHFMNAYYNTYSNAKYRVDLIGTTLDNKDVILETIMVDAPTRTGIIDKLPDENGQLQPIKTLGGKVDTTYEQYHYTCSFTEKNQSWKTYPKLTARIMHLGSLEAISFDAKAPAKDPKGATYVLPRYAEQSVLVKLSLSTIAKPTVSLLKEDGKFVTDDLLYEVNWGAITDETQKMDVGGYLITAKVTSDVDTENKAKPHYFYVTDVEQNADTIGLDFDKLAKNGVVTDVTSHYTKADQTCTTRINLSAFDTDDEVEITIQAIARTHAQKYKDGSQGVPFLMTIPKRLKTPDVDKLTVIVSDNTIPSEAFIADEASYKKGVKLSFAKDAYTDNPLAKVNMAIAVYDSLPEGTDKEDKAFVTNAWDEGAYAVLYTKENAKDLGYVSNEQEVTLDLTAYERYPGEYAGKWLKIALCASCKTEIDSQWTDADPDGKTKNYIWIPIPRRKLSDVMILTSADRTEGEGAIADVIRYYYAGNIYENTQKQDEEIPITLKTLAFREEKNLDGYHVLVKARKADNTEVEWNVYLERHYGTELEKASFDGRWDVFLSGEGATQSPAGINAVCQQDATALYLGTIGKAFAQENEQTGEQALHLTIDAISKEYTISDAGFVLPMELIYVASDEEAGQFYLVLNDVTMFGESAYEEAAGRFIQQVRIIPYLKENTAYIPGQEGIFMSQE